MWYNDKDIKYCKNININNLHGYVLPHAGTKHSGNILSHTLRFKPVKKFSKILILYYPAFDKPNVNDKYYHEYYVPMNTVKYVCDNIWKISNKYTIKGFNVRDSTIQDKKILKEKFNLDNTLIILSVDFSHFIPLQEALKLENCAAHSIMLKNYNSECISVVDHIETFKLFDSLLKTKYKLNKNLFFQWIGRTRSSGLKGVGYLSFLLREKINKKIDVPEGFFVTAFDKNMNQRECLGNLNNWNEKKEKELINEVIYKAKNESRLTSGKYLDVPITNYSVTYLFKDNKNKKFIRGYHGISKNSFYLPDVFLENTYNNGKWINFSDNEWPQYNVFKLDETLIMLDNKTKKYKKNNENINFNNNYILYNTQVTHHNL